MDQGQLPAMELIEGLFLLVAGALLLTPGFFTDAIGFAFLTPPLRRGIIRYILTKGIIRGPNQSGPSPRSNSSRTIEGEFRHMDD